MADLDAKQLRTVIREELEPVKQDLKGIHETLGGHSKKFGRLEDKVDALSGDIEALHLDVKGIRDKEGMAHGRNKREIDEIKTHLGLPLIPDAPEI